jgi:hypothetical protein
MYNYYMAYQEENENVSVLIKQKEDLISENIALEVKVLRNKKIVETLEKEIYKLCIHEWERDWTSSFDDLCKYNCKKCKLWRNSYMYN